MRDLREHVLEGLASFEEIPPDVNEIVARRESVLELGLPYIVAEAEGKIVGYAYASLYRTRSAYRHTLEDSVYVREGLRRSRHAACAPQPSSSRDVRAGPRRQMSR
jgi:phosphinothricin acetyltransferase